MYAVFVNLGSVTFTGPKSFVNNTAQIVIYMHYFVSVPNESMQHISWSPEFSVTLTILVVAQCNISDLSSSVLARSVIHCLCQRNQACNEFLFNLPHGDNYGLQ